MKQKDLAKIIRDTNGEVFTAIFVKKNGEQRTMKAQLGVQKDLKGVGMSYDAKEYGLITVFDVDKDAYRTIPIEGLIQVEVNDKIFTVDDEGGENGKV